MPELANPTIALDYRGLSGNPGGQNPFELMNTLANTQRTMLDVQNSRQMLAAKQRAGQLIAGSGSMDEAMRKIQADPLTAGFATDLMPLLQGVSTSQTQQAGMVQSQSQSGLNDVMATIGQTLLADPSGKSTQAAVASRLNTLSPAARANVEPAFNRLIQGLTGGIDPNDPNAATTIRQRAAGIGIAGGATPDTIRAITGSVAPSVTMQPDATGAQRPTVQGSSDLVSPPSAEYIGHPGSSVLGPTPGEVSLQNQRAAVEGQTATDMASAAATVPGDLRNIGLIRDALKVINTGGGAKPRAELAQTAQALKNAGFTGISDEAISMIANGQNGTIDGLPASQLLAKELSGVSLSALRQAAQGLGKATAPEINMALDQTDLDKDPKMLATLVDQMDYQLQMQKDRSEKYFGPYSQALKSKTADQGSFQEWYNHNHLDDFNAQFEKSHPKVIGSSGDNNKAVLDSIFGQ